MIRRTTRLLLIREIDEWDHRSILSLAFAGEHMDFLADDICQLKLNQAWRGEMQPFTPKWKMAVGMLLPFCIFFCNIMIRRECDWKCTGALSFFDFYNAPIIKFATYTISYMVYLVLFSIVMLTQLQPDNISIFEYLVWVWAVSMYVEELRLFFCGWKKAKFRLNPRRNEYFDSWWNIYDQCLFVLLVIGVIFRYTLHVDRFEGTLDVYALAFVFYVLRILQNFYVVRALGPKIEIIYRMLRDLLFFLVIFGLFLMAFGIAFQALVHPFPSAFKPLSQTNETVVFEMLKHIVYVPYFAIFQQFDDLKTQISDCSYLNFSSMDTDIDVSRCSNLATIFYLVYILITALLLVNLLIATFSSSFGRIEQNATKTWLFYRFEIISEFIEKPILPPPFSIINHVWRLLVFCCQGNNDDDNNNKTLKDQGCCFTTCWGETQSLESKLNWREMNDEQKTRLERLETAAFEETKRSEQRDNTMIKFRQSLDDLLNQLGLKQDLSSRDTAVIVDIPNGLGDISPHTSNPVMFAHALARLDGSSRA